MRQYIKWRFIVFGIFIFAGILLSFGIRRILPYELVFNPHNRQGQAELRRIAQTSTPLITAISRYRQDHGKLPDSVLQLYPQYLNRDLNGAHHEWNGWAYHDNVGGVSYRIWYSLGRDPFLYYDWKPASNIWVYDPGDGGSTIVLNSYDHWRLSYQINLT